MGITHPFRTHGVNWNDLNTQLTIVHSNQESYGDTVIGTTPPLGFWIVVLIFEAEDPGRIVINELG